MNTAVIYVKSESVNYILWCIWQVVYIKHPIFCAQDMWMMLYCAWPTSYEWFAWIEIANSKYPKYAVVQTRFNNNVSHPRFPAHRQGCYLLLIITLLHCFLVNIVHPFLYSLYFTYIHLYFTLFHLSHVSYFTRTSTLSIHKVLLTILVLQLHYLC